MDGQGSRIRHSGLTRSGEEAPPRERRADGRRVQPPAKESSLLRSGTERGKVPGRPIGCAGVDGVIDVARVTQLCRQAGREIVLRVTCDAIAQPASCIPRRRKLR